MSVSVDAVINERARLNEWERAILSREQEWDTDERDLAMIQGGREALYGALMMRRAQR